MRTIMDDLLSDAIVSDEKYNKLYEELINVLTSHGNIKEGRKEEIVKLLEKRLAERKEEIKKEIVKKMGIKVILEEIEELCRLLKESCPELDIKIVYSFKNSFKK